MLLICAVSLILLERKITLATTPITIAASVVAGLLIASCWADLGQMNWKQAVIPVCAALVCGGFISLILAVVILLSDRFSDWTKRFAGFDDALLLLGVCAGALMSF
jgi:hypothetical protein